MNSVNYIKLAITIFMAIFLANISTIYFKTQPAETVVQSKNAPTMHHKPIDFVKLEQERWERLSKKHKI